MKVLLNFDYPNIIKNVVYPCLHYDLEYYYIYNDLDFSVRKVKVAHCSITDNSEIPNYVLNLVSNGDIPINKVDNVVYYNSDIIISKTFTKNSETPDFIYLKLNESIKISYEDNNLNFINTIVDDSTIEEFELQKKNIISDLVDNLSNSLK